MHRDTSGSGGGVDGCASSQARGLTPAVGVTLLVAITVLLGVVVGVLASGVADAPSNGPPTAAFSPEYGLDGAGNTNDRPYVLIRYEAGTVVDGDRLFIVDSDGNEIAWRDVWTGTDTVDGAGYAHVDGYDSDAVLNHACKGETYRVVWRPPEGGTDRVISEVPIDEPARGPAAAHC